MRSVRSVALGASLLALIISACGTGGGSSSPAPTNGTSSAPSAGTGGSGTTIKIGSDGFYEAKIVAEIYAQALEAKGYKIDRTGIGIGTRDVSAAALDSGQIQLKPEYVGSGLKFYSKNAAASGGASGSPAASVNPTDPKAEQAALQQIIDSKGLTVLDFAPASDQNGFVVRSDTAQQYSLTKMSDTTAIQDKIKWGLATDCPTNPLCGAPNGALQSAYGITQATITGATLLSACDQPMVDALSHKTIDLGELCTTQPDIGKNGWVLLADDKNSQPADNLAPLVRNDLLSSVDKASFEKILNDVSAKLTTPGLLALNQQFVFDKKDVGDIAKGWLQQNGFTTK